LQAKHPSIVDVRGKGLMLAAQVDSADLAKTILARLLERKIIINRTDETVLRFLPPFILQREHVDTTTQAIDEILTEIEAAVGTPSQETVAQGGR
jgi:acetylornithine aminotransferase/acetylornithine/N-succinyldiaminopimelate aminotransferase